MNQIIPVENIGILNPDEVHQQIGSLVEPVYLQSRNAAIDRYYELAGTGKTSTTLKETIAAAYYGRVDQLFVAIDVQQWGNFDPDANEIHLHSEVIPGDEDLLNVSTVQTVLNGGAVYVLRLEEVPEQVPLAAPFCY